MKQKGRRRKSDHIKELHKNLAELVEGPEQPPIATCAALASLNDGSVCDEPINQSDTKVWSLQGLDITLQNAMDTANQHGTDIITQNVSNSQSEKDPSPNLLRTLPPILMTTRQTQTCKGPAAGRTSTS